MLGLGLAAFAGPVADNAGTALPELILRVVGLGLLPWAAFNLWIARQPQLPAAAVTLNIVGDTAWVLASLAVLMLLGQAFTLLGIVGFVAVTAFVAVIGFGKTLGLRALRTA